MFKKAVDALGVVSVVAATPAALSGSYLGVLALLARPAKHPTEETSIRFAFVVPAHNESLSIANTIASLSDVDYPKHNMRIVVVADNCVDDTAAVAQNAGAEVLVRSDTTRRGKGYALDYAFETLLGVDPQCADDSTIDAVVVVDADTLVSRNLLKAFAGRLVAGEQVLQATYRVANDDATWRTSLMAVAFTCIHDVRSLGRERLRLSTGLRGNGMCFSTAALGRVPHRAASLVEDVEHGLDLAEAGIRVAFVHEARVEAEMPEQAEESASQRKRWEDGRSKLKRERLPRLTRTAIAKRDPMLADLAVDLAIPPLARLGMALGAAVTAGSASRLVMGRWPKMIFPTGLGIVGLLSHVGVGWKLSGTGTTGLKALLQVPRYVFWKLRLRAPGAASSKNGLLKDPQGADEWVRTKRNAERNQLN